MTTTQTVFLQAGDVTAQGQTVASVTAADDHKFRTVTFTDGTVVVSKVMASWSVADKWAAYRRQKAVKAGLARVLTDTGEFWHFTYDDIATVCGKVVSGSDSDIGRFYCLTCQKATGQ